MTHPIGTQFFPILPSGILESVPAHFLEASPQTPILFHYACISIHPHGWIYRHSFYENRSCCLHKLVMQNMISMEKWSDSPKQMENTWNFIAKYEWSPWSCAFLALVASKLHGTCVWFSKCRLYANSYASTCPKSTVLSFLWSPCIKNWCTISFQKYLQMELESSAIDVILSNSVFQIIFLWHFSFVSASWCWCKGSWLCVFDVTW